MFFHCAVNSPRVTEGTREKDEGQRQVDPRHVAGLPEKGWDGTRPSSETFGGCALPRKGWYETRISVESQT